MKIAVCDDDRPIREYMEEAFVSHDEWKDGGGHLTTHGELHA